MKKLVKIPFNHELIGKEGIVITDRFGNICEVFLSKNAIKANFKNSIVAFNGDGHYRVHNIKGKLVNALLCSDYDLIMYQEVEQKEPRVIWVNIYPNSSIFAHNSKEDSFSDLMPGGKTVKFIEVIEEGEDYYNETFEQ